MQAYHNPSLAINGLTNPLSSHKNEFFLQGNGFKNRLLARHFLIEK